MISMSYLTFISLSVTLLGLPVSSWEKSTCNKTRKQKVIENLPQKLQPWTYHNKLSNKYENNGQFWNLLVMRILILNLIFIFVKYNWVINSLRQCQKLNVPAVKGYKNNYQFICILTLLLMESKNEHGGEGGGGVGLKVQ